MKIKKTNEMALENVIVSVFCSVLQIELVQEIEILSSSLKIRIQSRNRQTWIE